MKNVLIAVGVVALIVIVYLFWKNQKAIEAEAVDAKAPLIRDVSQRVGQSTITGYRPRTGVNLLAVK